MTHKERRESGLAFNQHKRPASARSENAVAVAARDNAKMAKLEERVSSQKEASRADCFSQGGVFEQGWLCRASGLLCICWRRRWVPRGAVALVRVSSALPICRRPGARAAFGIPAFGAILAGVMCLNSCVLCMR